MKKGWKILLRFILMSSSELSVLKMINITIPENQNINAGKNLICGEVLFSKKKYLQKQEGSFLLD